MSHENHSHESPERTLNREQANAYIERAAYTFDPELLKQLEQLTAVYFRCIDDRASNAQVEHDQPLAIPGAGLGVLMDVFGGLQHLETTTGEKVDLAPADIAKAVSDVIGTPSCHTDAEKVEEGAASPCAGCGHCAGALAQGDAYLLRPEIVSYFNDEYLAQLKTEIEPTVYPGKHDAHAVMIIDELDVGLPSHSEGDQVYVYHRAWHTKILNALGKALVEKLQANHSDITEEVLREALQTAANTRLAVTVEHLASHLPMFVVKRNDTGAVEATPAT